MASGACVAPEIAAAGLSKTAELISESLALDEPSEWWLDGCVRR